MEKILVSLLFRLINHAALHDWAISWNADTVVLNRIDIATLQRKTPSLDRVN
jgi:hypothetical protein